MVLAQPEKLREGAPRSPDENLFPVADARVRSLESSVRCAVAAADYLKRRELPSERDLRSEPPFIEAIANHLGFA